MQALSEEYAETAARLHARLKQARREALTDDGFLATFERQRRLGNLYQMWVDCRETAQTLLHYYDRGVVSNKTKQKSQRRTDLCGGDER